MKNIKVNINRTQPGSEEILAKRDFSQVMKQYQHISKPFFKQPWFMGTAGLATVAAVVVSVLLFTKKPAPVAEPASQSPVSQTVALVSDTCLTAKNGTTVRPPVPGLDLPYERYSVSSDKPTELTYKTGTKIMIPAGAFVDKDGKAVTGKVDILYREFHDVVDFFAAGIPMAYDTGGIKHQFESAGMMDIRGYQNGEQVFIGPGKKLDIAMASRQKGTSYNLYELDTTKGEWECLGKEVVTPIKKEKPVTAAIALPKPVMEEVRHVSSAQKSDSRPDGSTAAAKDDKLPALPTAPRKANVERGAFTLEVDPKDFPEIAIYRNVKFEIGEENKNIRKDIEKITWEDVSLKEGTKQGSYQMTLTKGKTRTNLVVYPVFEGKDFDAAEAEYKKKYKEYEATLQKRKDDEKKRADEELARFKAEEAAAKARYELAKKRWKEQQDSIDRTLTQMQRAQNQAAVVTRSFSIRGFGYYNCDRPQAWPTGKTINLQMVDEQGQPVKVYMLYLAQAKMNGMFNFYHNQLANFTFNPNTDNTIWVVTTDGKLVYVRPNEFRQAHENNELPLKMNTCPPNINTVEEVRGVLGI